MSPVELRSIAIEACVRAAELIRRSDQLRPLRTKSSDTDIVTGTDIAVEQLLVDLLSERTPGARLLAEEGGHATAGVGPHGGIEWVVDPIDGTVNFAYGIPVTAVSVAAVQEGRPVAAAVIDTGRVEVFSAHLGGGARLGDTPIEVGRCDVLGQALVATGFSYRAELRQSHGATIARLLGQVRDVRGFGSAALHMCWVASGRLDAYVERDIKPWDYAASSLIATEAGAVVELPCIENDGLVFATNSALRMSMRPFLI